MGNCGCKDNAGEDGQLQVDQNDPEMQNAALKIQNHYRNKKQGGVRAGAPDGEDGKHAPSENFATPLKEVPNYSNPNTLATLQRIGAFVYD
mmetsp:Transcript_18116/g.15811  ORF Transcript_18116/g.15811 Transcript_18116/m.15811 type:complete len:91 (+) Transcript_18116:186-458(+)